MDMLIIIGILLAALVGFFLLRFLFIILIMFLPAIICSGLCILCFATGHDNLAVIFLILAIAFFASQGEWMDSIPGFRKLAEKFEDWLG